MQKKTKFTKAQIRDSERYALKKDLVDALLDESKTYTISEVDDIIEQFMKGSAV